MYTYLRIYIYLSYMVVVSIYCTLQICYLDCICYKFYQPIFLEGAFLEDKDEVSGAPDKNMTDWM